MHTLECPLCVKMTDAAEQVISNPLSELSPGYCSDCKDAGRAVPMEQRVAKKAGPVKSPSV
jgi:hypothetical protein